MNFTFNKEQKEMLMLLAPDIIEEFSSNLELNEDQEDAVLDLVVDHLSYCGFDKDYVANETGEICEDIITELTKYR